MKHRVSSADHRTDGIEITNIDLVEIDLSRHVGKVLLTSGGEVVNDLDRNVAQGEQPANQRRSNKSRSSSYNIFLHDSFGRPSNKLGFLTLLYCERVREGDKRCGTFVLPALALD